MIGGRRQYDLVTERKNYNYKSYFHPSSVSSDVEEARKNRMTTAVSSLIEIHPNWQSAEVCVGP
jgi:hypothetical protein